MPLFISNSKPQPSKNWLLVWLLVFVINAVVLFQYESFLTKHNFTTSVEPSKDLWSWYRKKINGEKNTIVLLGASRSLLGLNIDTIKQMFPEHKVYQLSLNGRFPVNTLLEIANDENFVGTLIVSVKVEAFMKVFFPMQDDYNDYYANESSWYKSLDAYITAWIQSNFISLNNALSLQKITEYYDLNHLFLKAEHTTGNLDLSISADFSKVDAQLLADHFVGNRTKNLKKNKMPEPEELFKDLAVVIKAVNKLKQRGGQVIFVRFPTDKGHWQLDEQYLSRKSYWDLFTKEIGTDTIHFKDVEGLDQFDLPDTSHLDQKDAAAFTTLLFNYIQNNHLLNTSTNHPTSRSQGH
jgi:hypothetical protein